MLITCNADLIQGARILDLASHDGRWAFAAIKNGARHVTGVEGRSYLVQYAEQNFEKYGVPTSQYDFVHADCVDAVRLFDVSQFDVIFCFGFLYHTPNHFQLLHAITRLAPRALLIDSILINSPTPVVMLGTDDSTLEGASIALIPEQPETLVGIPTTRALELMLEYLGWDVRYLSWLEAQWPDWVGIEDYRDRKRFTLVARKATGRRGDTSGNGTNVPI
jgi:predicted nicotinamide N-methyase